MKQLPATAVELIDALDALFPPRCIQHGESIEDHLRHAGKCELIQFLKRVRDDAGGTRPTDQLIR